MKFTWNDVEYTWYGGFGVLFSSRESVPEYTLRMVGGRLFEARKAPYYDQPWNWFARPLIQWWIVDDDLQSIEQIRAFRCKVFGC